LDGSRDHGLGEPKIVKEVRRMRRDKKTKIPIFVAVFLVCWIGGGPLWAAQSDRKAKLIEGAKKEGDLVWYASMAIDTAKPMLDAFSKVYPFIKVKLVRTGTAQLINRIRTETLAGRWLFDVVGVSAIQVLAEQDILTPYFSPEREAYPGTFKDPQGRWTATYNNNLVLTYNKDQVSEKEVPKDYGDLLDPKWKGKILMDSADYNWYGTLVAVWGREKATQYMKQLARQDPKWIRGHGLIGQLIRPRGLGGYF
jgi:iron(III) transport system substrate-binding protein